MPRTRRYRVEIEIITQDDGEQDASYTIEEQNQRDSTVWDVRWTSAATDLDDLVRSVGGDLRQVLSG